jgi:hypothetical protein
MENKIEKIAKTEIENFDTKKISRKDAIKRTGYIAASAATMMILMSNPSQAGPAGSPNSARPAPPPKKDDGNHGGRGPWH